VIRIAAPSQVVVVTIIADSSPLSSSPHCIATAPALKQAQAARYPEAKMPVGTQGRSAARSRRLTRAKISSIGVALGSIIATIITNHIDTIKAA